MRASSFLSRLAAPLAAVVIVLAGAAATSPAFAQASASAPVINAASAAPTPAMTLPPITPPASIANPYGLRALWEQGDWVARATLLILAIMSLGSWYVLISKLVAWGSSRQQAVSRMRRAVAEYDVRGIRATVPFFRWLLDQPVFRDATFDTEFLDTLLQQRRGKSFSEPESSLREVALIAAALHASRATASRPRGLAESAWTQQAKREILQ